MENTDHRFAGIPENPDICTNVREADFWGVEMIKRSTLVVILLVLLGVMIISLMVTQDKPQKINNPIRFEYIGVGGEGKDCGNAGKDCR
jgi:hypothetical protein